MYPNLTRMIVEIARDNDMVLKPRKQWQWPDNAAKLEKLATTINKSVQLDFASGDCDVVNGHISKNPKLQAVSDFLEMVFDGELTSAFYTDESSYAKFLKERG